MTIAPTTTLYGYQELVHERIQSLHHEAAAERLARRVRRVQKAHRQVERAAQRLSQALARL